MRVQYGDRVVASSFTLLVTDSEEAQITDPVPNFPANLKIAFKPPEGKPPSWAFEAIDAQNLKLTLVGWNSAVGTAFDKPVKIGTLGGADVAIMVCHYKIGILNRLDVQMLIGGKYG